MSLGLHGNEAQVVHQTMLIFIRVGWPKRRGRKERGSALARWPAGGVWRGLSIRVPVQPCTGPTALTLAQQSDRQQLPSSCRPIGVGPNPSTLIFMQKCWTNSIFTHSPDNSAGLSLRLSSACGVSACLRKHRSGNGRRSAKPTITIGGYLLCP